jgi:hypothetical protein
MFPTSGCSVHVVCRADCVCWPDGEFTAMEQRFLKAVWDPRSHGATVDRVLWAIQHFGDLFTRHRLAHLLSVPLDRCTYVHWTATYSLLKDADICSMDTCKACLQDLPLCLQVGTFVGRAWSPSMANTHPGRPGPGTFTPVHIAPSRWQETILALGAYPVCGCGWSSCHAHNGGQLPRHTTKLVQQWRRWSARPKRRLFCRALTG